MCNPGHVLESSLGRIIENMGKTLCSLKESYRSHYRAPAELGKITPWAGQGFPGRPCLGRHWSVGDSWTPQQDALHLCFSLSLLLPESPRPRTTILSDASVLLKYFLAKWALATAKSNFPSVGQCVIVSPVCNFDSVGLDLVEAPPIIVVQLRASSIAQNSASSGYWKD